MSVFAYITIWDVFAKLAIAYALYATSADRLIMYSTLMVIVSAISPLLYWLYCKKHYQESEVIWKPNFAKIKEIYSFTGWAMLGGMANMGYTQGVNILLGMFFLPAVNAARGIAVQVQGVINNFVVNFQIAIDPQITKSYARGDREYMKDLVCSSSKYSYYLLFFLSLPIFFEADTLLGLWLVEVPKYSANFLRLIIVATIIDAIMNPAVKAIFATGNIRRYQVIANGVMLMVVPLSYCALRMGGNPYVVFIIHVLVAFVVMLIKIELTKQIVGIGRRKFLHEVIVPIVIVTIMSSIIPGLLFLTLTSTLTRLIVIGIVCVSSVIISIYLFGISANDRRMIIQKIKGLPSVSL